MNTMYHVACLQHYSPSIGRSFFQLSLSHKFPAFITLAEPVSPSVKGGQALGVKIPSCWIALTSCLHFLSQPAHFSQFILHREPS